MKKHSINILYGSVALEELIVKSIAKEILNVVINNYLEEKRNENDN